MVLAMSILTEPGPRVRPQGVRWLGVACYALAAYLAGDGILVALGTVSFASGAYWLGGLETMGPLIYFIVAAALAALGFGLLRGWSLARRAAVIAAGLLVAGAVMPVSAAVVYGQVLGMMTQGVKIIAAIMVIRYLLLGDVVEWFASSKT
jgi:hypothetical protein